MRLETKSDVAGPQEVQLVQSVSPDSSWLGGLNFLWLEITKRCNLNCVHCYADSNPQQALTGTMTYEDWRHVLDEGYLSGCKVVQFIGGEPMLHPNLFELIADARSIGYELVEVFTNGTLLRPPTLDALRRFDVRLAFSLYAERPDVHDNITRNKGSFFRTVAGIRGAVKTGLTTRVGLIVMEANAAYVEDTKEFLRRLGVTSVGIDRVRGIGRGNALTPNASPFEELCGSCWKGKLCINPDGEVSPCVFSWFHTVGNAKQGLPDILNGERLHDFRTRSRAQDLKRLNAQSGTYCPPDLRPCYPDCAPACQPCVPDMRVDITG